MKYLITGIDGFAGKYLSKHLHSKNADVYGLHKHKAPDETNPKIYECDITDSKNVSYIINTINPDCIIHLAAQADVAASWDNVATTLNVNLMGTVNILEALRYQNKKTVKMLNVCSGDIYGKVSQGSITETTPLSPQNPYAVSKAGVDYISAVYGKNLNIHVVTARAFNHSGPGQSPAFVISDFASQIAKIEKKQQEPVIKTGNLDSYRDFTDVRDIIKAYILLTEKGHAGEAYNIASGKLYKIKDILNILVSLSTTDINIVTDQNKLRPADPNPAIISTEKIFKDTGWKPEISLETTLSDTLNWWRENI